MTARDEAEDRRLDWALGEKLGGETPPDLASCIVAGHRRGDGARLRPLQPVPPTRRWLAAALILLGLGVVFAVALHRDAADAPTPVAPSPPQQPAPAQVYSVADVDNLPPDTRRVSMRDCGDDVAAALRRLCDLEDLEVHVSDREVFGMGLKVARTQPCPSITHAGLNDLCRLGKLRRLVLSGTFGVRPAGPDTWGIFDDLQKLPLLQELALKFFDVPDNEGVGCFDVLPKLSALRRLDLSFDHGFGERGIDIILRCQGLESLSLRGCQQLHGSWLAKLGTLPHLRQLDVSLIDGINWRNVPGEEQDPLIATTLFGARETARQPGTGVTDTALAGIARCRTLQHLDLSNSRFTDAGAAVLADLTGLEQLDLGGNPIGDSVIDDLPPSLTRLVLCSDNLTDACCSKLRQRLTHLVHLDISACYGIHDRGVADLVAMPTLRHLEIRQMYGLTAASIEHFLKATQLEQLDLRICDFVTAQHVVALRRALPNLRVLQTNVPDEAVQEAEKLPPAVSVRSKAEVEALPADTRNVEAIGIGDDAMVAFERLRELERLVITRDGVDAVQTILPDAESSISSVGDYSLRHLAKLSHLRILTVRGHYRFTGEGLKHLVDTPLQELSCENIADVELSRLARLPKLRRLEFRRSYRGVTEDVVQAIAGCTSLRELSLVASLWPASLLPLASLPSLESLQLVNACTVFVLGAGTATPDGGAAASVEFPVAGKDGALDAIASMRALRQLKLAGWQLTRRLDQLAQPEQLAIVECGFGDDFLEHLPPSITSLSLSHCHGVTDRAGEILAARLPVLQSLDLSHCDGLTDAAFAGLLQIHSLQHLDLSYCQGLTKSAAAALAAACVPGAIPTTTKIRSLTVRGWQLDADALQLLRHLPFLQTLVTDAGTEQLTK